MTTATRKKRPTKKKPPILNHLTIEGKEYVLVPVEEFKELMVDHMLGILSQEALAEDDTFIPLEEVEARIAKARKGKKRG